MGRAKSDVEAALQRKGFRRDNNDHRYFIYWNRKGLKTVRKTKTSHGSAKYKELGDPLIQSMARQCGLTKKSFLELVDCTLDQAGYEKLVF
jgi:hypothetical protein